MRCRDVNNLYIWTLHQIFIGSKCVACLRGANFSEELLCFGLRGRGTNSSEDVHHIRDPAAERINSEILTKFYFVWSSTIILTEKGGANHTFCYSTSSCLSSAECRHLHCSHFACTYQLSPNATQKCPQMNSPTYPFSYLSSQTYEKDSVRRIRKRLRTRAGFVWSKACHVTRCAPNAMKQLSGIKILFKYQVKMVDQTYGCVTSKELSSNTDVCWAYSFNHPQHEIIKEDNYDLHHHCWYWNC